MTLKDGVIILQALVDSGEGDLPLRVATNFSRGLGGADTLYADDVIRADIETVTKWGKIDDRGSTRVVVLYAE